MRPYQNITDDELASLGADRRWDPDLLLALPLPAPVLWVHTQRDKHRNADQSSLIKRITVTAVCGDVVKTDFGSYSLQSGKNLFYACGFTHIGDCCGQLYLLTDPTH